LRLERKLVVAVLILFLAPTLVAGAVFVLLYRRGVLDDPAALTLAVALGFLAMMIYIGLMAHGLGRTFVRSIQAIQLGTELMATVNPDHRLAITSGDELQALAEEINRMADRVRDGRLGLEAQIAEATHSLHLERATLATVLDALGEGVIVASPEGRVTLANLAAQERLAVGGAWLLGRSLFDFVDREKIGHFLDRLRASGGSLERFSLEPAGGGVLEAVMTPLVDAERGVVGFVLVLRDVTTPARSDEARRERLVETVRSLRGPLASVRSLAENLLDDAGAVATAARPLLTAIHIEAIRLSALVGGQALAGESAPAHFERLTVADLTAITLRRLVAEGVAPDLVETGDTAGLPALRAEAAALSAAVAQLARAALARRAPAGRAWLRWSQRGGVVQVDVGADGSTGLAVLEPVLDTTVTVGGGPVSVREVIRRHGGESWAHAGEGQFGFRASFPAAPPVVAEPTVRPPFVGAGLISGVSPDDVPAGRPDFYDFSLLEDMERQVAAAQRDRPLTALEYVVLDTETTGLAPQHGDRIVSLAAVKIRGGAVRSGETFDALVNPRRPIPAASVRFHGITDQLVADQPPIDVVLPAFLRFAEGAVLVGHQVWFDILFLAREAEPLGIRAITARHAVLDTLLLSEVVHGPLPGHALEDAARRLGVVVRGRHSALGDALTTAEVLVRLIPLLGKRGIVTLGQALEAARRARRAWRADSGRETGA
jgi:DNA polymerase-3 subunit epsilon